ncbi:YhdP family protein [Niveibacterium sp. 24ML]|uniref:YhdP family protein n=1 Tax=Niveibacterium sp. 24ML TaxID=2985512 RepID=UPI00226F8E1A|nr:YhdP family protein [Niveibacterium sp. 24ML]MCX9157644.1 YhdP family protein [Niveibacterium sp. 24ML]
MLPSYFRFQLSRYAPHGLQTRWVRVALWAAVVAYFAGGIGLLVLRHALLPQAGQWRPQIEQSLSQALGQTVTIGHLHADWDGLRPRLRLRDLTLQPHGGGVPLHLQAVDASMSWRSLFVGGLRLHQLVVDRPALTLVRETDGAIHLAGFSAAPGEDDAAMREWLLDQRAIVIRDAEVVWQDLLRGAPPLRLSRLNLRLESAGKTHRVGLTASPPAPLATPLDLRGRIKADPGAPVSEWSGELYASVDRADFAAWKPWLDWPQALLYARGGVRVWLGFEQGGLTLGVADFALRGPALRFAGEAEPLRLGWIRGRLEAMRQGGVLRLAGRDLALRTDEGGEMSAASFRFERAAGAAGEPARAEFSAQSLDLAVLTSIMRRVPLRSALRSQLQALAPHGRIERIDLGWEGEGGMPARYRMAARFAGLGLAPQGLWPGGTGWSGTVSATERGGQFELNVDKGALALPAVFDAGDIAIEAANFSGDWQLNNGQASVRLARAEFHNKDASGSAKGVWRTKGEGPGEIDIEARLSRADGSAVWRYMPTVVDAEVRHWLRDAITHGEAQDATLVLRGDLANFPFTDDPKGVFTVDARVLGSRLQYAPDWPAIDDIDGRLRFERARMEIHADRGKVFGAQVSQVRAVIEDLELGALAIDGKASGPTREFLQFINASPIADKVGYFTRGVDATGDGALTLRLAVPLAEPEKTTTEGEFRFADNRLRLLPGLPDLESASGRFGFTESRFSIPEASGAFLGTPVRVRGDTRRDGAIEIEAHGSVSARHLASLYPAQAWDHIAGETPAIARIVAREHDVALTLETSLLGVASSLPDPLNKSAGEALPFSLDWRWQNQSQQARQQVEAQLKGRARLRLAIHEQDGALKIDQGVLALGTADVALPGRGLALRARVDHLDLDAWRDALGSAGQDAGTPPFDSVAVHAGDLVLRGLRFHDQGLVAQREGERWRGQLDGPAAEGSISIDTRGAGQIEARLSRLALLPVQSARTPARRLDPKAGAARLPQVDLKVGALMYAARDVGALSLRGAPDGEDWQLEQLLLSNDDGRISLNGAYQGGQTRVRFDLDARDAGALLGRLGHPGLLRRGEVTARGALAWRGDPATPDIASLSGDFTLTAASGQFSKVDPGMGRLLGVLSLQSLPRRATLDFRDVFSEGFAFDSVSGSMKIHQGIMRTDDLRIRGPAARVSMQGSVNLATETQALRVQVQPTLSETVALGVALGPAIGTLNPAVGLVAYLAQKILSDPVEKMFTYDYAVDGSWAEPRVRKLDGAPALEENSGGKQ